MDRRDFTKRIAQASSFAVLTASARRTAAALPSSPSPETPLMAHTLPTLPYDFAALEPHIDAQTMQIHHGKHHQAYVNNLLNKRYRVSFVDFASYGTASWNRPRNYGVKVRAAF